MTDPRLNARMLIDAGREERLSDAQRARSAARWALLVASEGAALGASAAAPPAASASAAAGKVALGVGAKVKIIGGLLGILAVGAAVRWIVPTSHVTDSHEVPTATVIEVTPPIPTTVEPLATPQDPVVDQTPPAQPRSASVPRARASSEASSLADEVRVMREVQAALRGGRPARALAILDDAKGRSLGHDLAEERGAARVVALCDLGLRDEAREAARRFLQTWPTSALRDRVRGTCAVGSPEPSKP